MEQYTLIGHPLGHSMSPFIHERLFALAGSLLYADRPGTGTAAGCRRFAAAAARL